MSKLHLKINSLDDQWHDRDEILLHASFQILADFMEKEKPGKSIDWSHDKLHRRAWKEMNSLYSWWKKERPTRKSPLDNKRLLRPPFKFEKIEGENLSRLVKPDKKKYAAYYRALKKDWRLEDRWNEEDQKNLRRLIQIRRFLWT